MRAPTLVAAALLAATAAFLPVVTPAAQQAMQHQGGTEMPASGDPDIDFARMMIPHHQGAIEMAKTELQNGKDPEMRRLAEEIIKAQEREIEFLQGWLQKKGG